MSNARARKKRARKLKHKKTIQDSQSIKTLKEFLEEENVSSNSVDTHRFNTVSLEGFFDDQEQNPITRFDKDKTAEALQRMFND